MTSADEPRANGMLAVADDQQVYWEEWGDPTGLPALYLHGGPGSGLRTSQYRHRFDLARMRVIGLDQRGCGRSLPHAGDHDTSLTANTTAHLLGDIEALREARGIEAWVVNGVSWGSTLALAYAQAHRERVLGLVLYAVTSTSRREVDWLTEGVGSIFPEAWERFAAFAEQHAGYRRGEERLVAAYARLMESADPDLRDRASQEWALWEDTHVSLAAGVVERDPRWSDLRIRLAFFRLAARYFSHDGFCDPPLADRMSRLHGIPGVMLHGRQDVSSPLVTAWTLHRRWPGSELIVDEGSGHGGVSMGESWREANECLAARLG